MTSLKKTLIVAVVMMGSAVSAGRAMGQTREQLAAECQALLQQRNSLCAKGQEILNLLNSSTAFYFYDNKTQSYTTTDVGAIRAYIERSTDQGNWKAWWDYYLYFHQLRRGQLQAQFNQMGQQFQQMQARLTQLWNQLQAPAAGAVYRLEGGAPRIVAAGSNTQGNTYLNVATVAAGVMTHTIRKLHGTTGQLEADWAFQHAFTSLPGEIRQGQVLNIRLSSAASGSKMEQFIGSSVGVNWGVGGWANVNYTNRGATVVGRMTATGELRTAHSAEANLTVGGTANTLTVEFCGPNGCRVIYRYVRVQ